MNGKSENLVLEQLGAKRSDIAEMADRLQLLTVEMTAMRHLSAGALVVQEHVDIAALKSRLDLVD